MQVDTYREGQRLLEKHRFQFPPSWLYIDNIEGEWGAFQDIMKRKAVSIQNQLATLQMKISQQNGVVEQRLVGNRVDDVTSVAFSALWSCWLIGTVASQLPVT